MWSDYIKQMKQKWVGEIVIFDHACHTVVGVDMNGALLIDKASQFNETTAVSESDVKTVPKQFVEIGKQWTINNVDDLALALAVLKGNEFIANMSDSYAATCSELAEVERQRADVLQQAKEKNLLQELQYKQRIKKALIEAILFYQSDDLHTRQQLESMQLCELDELFDKCKP